MRLYLFITSKCIIKKQPVDVKIHRLNNLKKDNVRKETLKIGQTYGMLHDNNHDYVVATVTYEITHTSA